MKTMKTGKVKSFLPGFYRNFRPEQDESFRGYLLRLAETNGLNGINGILRLLCDALPSLKKSLRVVRGNKEAITLLGQMAFGEPDGLMHCLAPVLANVATLVDDCRVDNDAMMEEYAQVCPKCLVEYGVALSPWDYAPIVGCVRHGTVLVDQCHECGTRLTWSRPNLMHCGRCGANLRYAKPAPLPLDLLDTLQDFEVMAPFRFFLHGTAIDNAPWDTAFQITKLLALEDIHWWNEKWPPNRYFSHLDIGQALEKFATSRIPGGYNALILKPFLEEKLQHLRGIPASHLCQESTFSFIVNEVGLIGEYAQAMTYEAPRPPFVRGATLFSGRPPILTTDADVACFLSIDLDSFEKLLQMEILRRPILDELGHDIDRVLEAQKFLDEELLSISKIRSLVGVAVDWEDLSRRRV
jgi:hypothetical protein